MHIHEAVSKAMQKNVGLYRRNDRWPKGVWVLPTNTPLNLVLVTPDFECRKCWEPSAADLLANDWKVFEYLTPEEIEKAEKMREMLRAYWGER